MTVLSTLRLFPLRIIGSSSLSVTMWLTLTGEGWAIHTLARCLLRLEMNELLQIDHLWSLELVSISYEDIPTYLSIRHTVAGMKKGIQSITFNLLFCSGDPKKGRKSLWSNDRFFIDPLSADRRIFTWFWLLQARKLCPHNHYGTQQWLTPGSCSNSDNAGLDAVGYSGHGIYVVWQRENTTQLYT